MPQDLYAKPWLPVPVAAQLVRYTKAAADRLRIPRPSIYDLIDKSPNIRTAGDLAADEIVDCFRACGGDLDAMVVRLQVSKRAPHRRVKELGLLDRSGPTNRS